MRIEQVEDEGGGSELPGIFEERWADKGKLAAGFFLDGTLTNFDHGLQVKSSPLIKIGIERSDDGFPDAGVLPAVVALVAGLPGGGSGWKVIPGDAGSELEEDVFKDLAVIEGRATAERSRRSLQLGGGREKRLEEEPLGVGEEHRDSEGDYLIKKGENKRIQFHSRWSGDKWNI
jgi:hypothetical protein